MRIYGDNRGQEAILKQSSGEKLESADSVIACLPAGKRGAVNEVYPPRILAGNLRGSKTGNLIIQDLIL
jgi:hypothetical protein